MKMHFANVKFLESVVGFLSSISNKANIFPWWLQQRPKEIHDNAFFKWQREDFVKRFHMFVRSISLQKLSKNHGAHNVTSRCPRMFWQNSFMKIA